MATSSKRPGGEASVSGAALPESVTDLTREQAARVGGASATGAIADIAEDGVAAKVGRYRWVICALLFFATTIN